MITTEFYHELLSKYVAIFGTLFNDIRISRTDGTTAKLQNFKVPISYGPKEKFLAIALQKPDKKVKAIQLPRMAFEISGIDYDPTRKFQRTQKFHQDEQMMFEPVPFNIGFKLFIIAKTTIDALKIVEQILPYFNPDWTVSAQLIEGMDRTWSIPIVRVGQSFEDGYEADFQTRRVIIWTIDFEMRAWLHGPIQPRKVIKFIKLNTYATMNTAAPVDQVTTIQPGLTANGQPTTDITQTIDYTLINEDDDWAVITQTFDVDPEE